MKINYKKLLKEDKFNVDKELLEKIEYKEVLFILSQEIIEYREKNNLKQIDLANKLNMSQVMISKIESGTYNPTVKKLVQIWNALSNENINFGANLLIKIYNKIVKNYNNCVMSEINQNEQENYEFNEENIKNTNSFCIKIKGKEDNHFLSYINSYDMAS